VSGGASSRVAGIIFRGAKPTAEPGDILVPSVFPLGKRSENFLGISAGFPKWSYASFDEIVISDEGTTSREPAIEAVEY
jgi:hypothetical protein